MRRTNYLFLQGMKRFNSITWSPLSFIFLEDVGPFQGDSEIEQRRDRWRTLALPDSSKRSGCVKTSDEPICYRRSVTVYSDGKFGANVLAETLVDNKSYVHSFGNYKLIYVKQKVCNCFCENYANEGIWNLIRVKFIWRRQKANKIN